MIVRALTSTGDWEYGAGKNSYKRNKDAVAQLIKTRLRSFLGDCFFALDSGIDWFNLAGSKERSLLELNIRTTILNTPDVTAIKQVFSRLDEERLLTISFEVNTIYGEIQEELFVIPEPITDNSVLLLEDGGKLLLEDGGEIILS